VLGNMCGLNAATHCDNGDLLVVDSTEFQSGSSATRIGRLSRELKSGKLRGIYAVDFVGETGLTGFVHECITPWLAWRKNWWKEKADFLLQSGTSLGRLRERKAARANSICNLGVRS